MGRYSSVVGEQRPTQLGGCWLDACNGYDVSAQIQVFGSKECDINDSELAPRWVTYIDTFYAMLDKKDDAKAGVKSSALLFGDNARVILAFLATLFVGGMASIGHLLGVNTAFYFVTVLGSTLHFLWQLYTADFDDPKSCMMQFNSNLKSLGGLTMAGILLG